MADGKGDQLGQKQEDMEKEMMERTASISLKIRETLRATLPSAPEQFFHVMVPGKVVNLEDYMEGFDEKTGKQTTIVLPTVTELNQAILCDDMPALSTVQLGPTGRSVSRSYAATLSKLVPSGTTVGVEVGDPNALTDAEKRYERAMEWLLAEDARNPGKSHLDSYIERQKVYTEAEERKIKRFDDAYISISSDPFIKTFSEQRAAYDRWVNENGRSLRNDVEGAYKDWVIHGRKEAVEYWFAMVDNDSAMARVEQSKEAMRNNVVMNTDGSVTYPKVSLTPSNWAWIAKQKMLSKTDETETASSLSFEIMALERKKNMIMALKNKPPEIKGPDGKALQVPSEDEGDEELKNAMQVYITARSKLDDELRKPDASDADKEKYKEAAEEAKKAKEALDTANENYNKKGIERLSLLSLKAAGDIYSEQAGKLDGELDAITAKIEEKKKALEVKLKKNVDDPVLKELLPSGAETKAPEAPKDKADYFTSITVEVSSSYDHSKSSQHAVTAGAKLKAGYGQLAAAAGAAHTKTSGDAESQMAKSNVKVSFECMRVDIDRPWLRPELFYDEDLRAGPGAHISPGYTRLAALMDPDNADIEGKISATERELELDRYNVFPLYPTAFLLACNVVLEISGETAAIQTHFDTSETTASIGLEYGPVKIPDPLPVGLSASASSKSENKHSTCEITANGCRITVMAPQIIGWISQMVPALPRKNQPAIPENSASAPVL